MKKINRLTDLLEDLTNTYEQLKDRKITNDDAKQISNMAAKILKAAAIQLSYNEYMKKKSPIKFLQ